MSNDLVERDSKPVVVEANPMAMLAHAVQRGMGADELSKLLDLQQRYEAAEAKKAFVSALAKFKANPPRIGKNKTVDFTSQKGRTTYKHATLDNVCDIIGGALAEVGISYRWKTEQIEGGMIRVGCILTHNLGHSEETWLQASPDQSGNKNNIQAVGSTVTYLQRYTLLSATGMAVAESDDDGRQGIKGLSEETLQAFRDEIAALKSDADAADLWKKIAQATTASGDVESHEILRSEVLAKRRELKGPL